MSMTSMFMAVAELSRQTSDDWLHDLNSGEFSYD